MPKYDPKKIEKKWQKYWAQTKAYQAKTFSEKPKKYVLVEFPYPSGDRLHMGHLRPYTAGDVVSRYNRAKGNEVVYPFGWDAFGLPAENYAIKMGVPPETTTAKNIQHAKEQVQAWGMSFDWSREVNTTDPDYYKWTQWIFLQFYNAGLAYEAIAPINWCPKDKTGLANEEVINGKCDRCGTPVIRKDMRQWFLRITEYAEKLLDGLKELDWPEAIKIQQENWIGKSTGAEIVFEVQSKDGDGKVTVFTTRPDTLFGATYLVLAPEHPLVQKLQPAIKNWKEVNKYIEDAKNKGDLVRTSLEKEKTGVELKGVWSINPATKSKIPVWIADYVLGSYGTGAIMAVPAHDERDMEFAKKFKLPIIEVIDRGGNLVNSGEFDGLSALQGKKKIIQKFGTPKTQYKLRDWLFSRQRYWGEPIPMIHCEKCGLVPVPEKDLPVKLPKVKKYLPTGTGESPLAAISSWVNVKCPQCKGPAKRETNTMPQWAGSSWYYLRYTDPKNKKAFAAKDKMEYWLPVDMYFGGMEHTTLHLLYSRFWNLFLYDQGLVPVKEPYQRRIPHGIVLAADGEKMSKSRGNVVNPDDIVKQYGADTLRMYELFLGPHDQAVSWNDKGIVGVYRFLQRTWSWVLENKASKIPDSDKASAEINKLIKNIGENLDALRFNTCVSGLMEFLNNVSAEKASKETLKKFLVVLSVFAPHISEELWHEIKEKGSITKQLWPEFDPAKAESSKVSFVVQVNGRYRGALEIAKDSEQLAVEKLAKEIPTVKNALGKEEIKKVIFVKNKIINFVV